jgi:hypothetical protein
MDHIQELLGNSTTIVGNEEISTITDTLANSSRPVKELNISGSFDATAMG